MAKNDAQDWFGLKAGHFVAVFSSLLLAALFNTFVLVLVGVYPPEAAGAYAPAYAALLLAALTLLLSLFVFKFTRDDAAGLGIANAAVLLSMAVAWKFVAENLEYPLGEQLSSGLIFALASAIVYFGVLYAALAPGKR